MSEEKKSIYTIELQCGNWSGSSKNHINDLDISEETGIPTYVRSIGQKSILPKDWQYKMAAVDSAARTFISNNSWPYIGNSRVVAELRIPKIVDQLKKFAEKKVDVVEQLIVALPDIKTEMKELYQNEWKDRFGWDDSKCDSEWKSVSTEYLAPEKIRKRCYMRWFFKSAEGFKVKEHSDQALVEMAAELELQWNEAKQEAMKAGVDMIREKLGTSVQRLCKEIASGKVVKEKTIDAVKSAQEWLDEVVTSVVGEDNDLAELSKKLKAEVGKIGKAVFLKGDKTLQANIQQLGEALSAKIDSIQGDLEKGGTYKRQLDFS